MYNKKNKAEPEMWPASWRSAVRRGICCDKDASPTFPNSLPDKKASGFHHHTSRHPCKRQDTATACPSSSQEIWTHKSDEAVPKIFSTMRKMTGSADFNAILCMSAQKLPLIETETLKMHVSDVVSELDSRASLVTQHSVSELGATEAEPP